MIATSSGSIHQLSATASGGSSASASSKTIIGGSSSSVEIRTSVDGVEHVERRESSDGGTISISVVATSSASSSQTVASSAVFTQAEQKTVTRMLDLFRDILAYFGIKI